QRDATPNVSVIPTELLKYAPTEAADLSALSLALCFAGANSSNPPTPFYTFIAQYTKKVSFFWDELDEGHQRLVTRMIPGNS
ncbi:hypothetical protein CRM22_002301, partial [Opisthorchis felineus]